MQEPTSGTEGFPGVAASSRSVLVPLDGSPAALAAMPVAREMARLIDGEVHVLHVGESRPPAFKGHELAVRLGLREEQLRGAVIEGLFGRAARTIVTAAREQRGAMIVMCAHTAGLRAGRAMGRTAEEVLLTAPCPVIFVPPPPPAPSWQAHVRREEQPWTLEQVLLPYDGTPATAAALAPSFALCSRARATLVVLHVAATARTISAEPSRAGGEPPPRALPPGSMSAPAYADHPHHEWAAWSRELIERICYLARLPEGTHIQLSLATGQPGPEILRCARERRIDLVVLAWHGSLAADRAATVKMLVEGAPCPVLFTRFDRRE